MSMKQKKSAGLSLRLLGEMDVRLNGEVVELPRSRKTRALLAYLALAPRPCRRSSLCNMFWERPNDPKGALRWSLSKIRPLLKDGDESRVVANGDFIHIDTENVDFDVRDLLGTAADLDACPTAHLERVISSGELLEGFKLPRCTDFELWLAEKREDVRRAQLSILNILCMRHDTQPERALNHARAAADVAPADPDVRLRLIDLLERTGRGDEAERQRQLCKDIIGARQRPLATSQDADPMSGRMADTGDRVEPHQPEAIKPSLQIPDRPSVAVLPFQTIGDRSESEVIALGLTHDVIRGLSRLR
jgi:DNA-binding SARP family transcriptional activator